jgi:hypothetical protein
VADNEEGHSIKRKKLGNKSKHSIKRIEQRKGLKIALLNYIDNKLASKKRIYLPPESIESYIKLTTPLKLEISNYIYF